jgi:hypothetical protein
MELPDQGPREIPRTFSRSPNGGMRTHVRFPPSPEALMRRVQRSLNPGSVALDDADGPPRRGDGSVRPSSRWWAKPRCAQTMHWSQHRRSAWADTSLAGRRQPKPYVDGGSLDQEMAQTARHRASWVGVASCAALPRRACLASAERGSIQGSRRRDGTHLTAIAWRRHQSSSSGSPGRMALRRFFSALAAENFAALPAEI